MASSNRLYVSTRKGLFQFHSCDGRGAWTGAAPALEGLDVYHAIEDPRDPSRVYAAANHAVWGPRVMRSVDGGRTWDEPVQSPAFPEGSGTAVKAVWFIRPGHAERPGEVWAGVEPAAIFRSNDWGATWELLNSLSDHPTNSYWMPGGGGLCLHGIAIDPLNPDSLIATISAGGSYRTDDGGASWRPINRGIRADFMPEKETPAGHCVHKLVRSAQDSNLLFQQNHCGMYMSADGGEQWREVTEGLPSEFGFPAAMHPHDGGTVYVAPLKGDSFRAVPEGRMTVWRSRDAGCRWEPLREGLPQQHAYLASYRAAMATDREDSAGIYFGTTTGQVFFSGNEGDRWVQLADYLPSVLAVEAS